MLAECQSKTNTQTHAKRSKKKSRRSREKEKRINVLRETHLINSRMKANACKRTDGKNRKLKNKYVKQTNRKVK